MDFRELLSGLQGSEALNQAAGQAGLDPDLAHEAVHGIIEHVCQGGSVQEAADAVAARVGVSPDQVQALLPQVLPLLQGHAACADGEQQAGMGGLIGRLGGLLG